MLPSRWSSVARAFGSPRQITGLETDALAQENSADELANMGNNGKKRMEPSPRLWMRLETVVVASPFWTPQISRRSCAPA